MKTSEGQTKLVVDIEGRAGSLHVTAQIATGEGPLVLVGPNAAGKTTLLLMILGVLRPDRGRISLGHQVLFDSAQRVDRPTEERGLGYVPQDYALFPHLTARDNVAFALAGRPGMGRAAARRERATELLAELDVRDAADALPAVLSGGQRQRVALARALAAAPQALLLDEPLAALDTSSRRQVREFLAGSLARLGLPALVVTHDPADAASLGHELAVLEAGRVVQTGTLAALAAAPFTSFVASFVAGFGRESSGGTPK